MIQYRKHQVWFNPFVWCGGDGVGVMNFEIENWDDVLWYVLFKSLSLIVDDAEIMVYTFYCV